jgi:hypothetical protein
MKLHLTQIALAASLAAAMGAAFADPSGANVPVSTYTPGPGVTDLYLAGSSAVDLALTKFIANSCLPGTLDTYRSDAGGKTYYLWTCEVNGSQSSIALASGNTLLAIHKNTNSSSDGTNAVATGASLAFMQVSDLTGAGKCAVTPTVFSATPVIPSYTYFTCGTTAGNAGVGTLSQVPNFGFSDSEPAQFASPVSNAGLLTTAYPLTILFGVPVTTGLRNALQAAQGLTVGAEDEGNMPTIASTTLNGIFTGRYSTLSAAGLPTTGFADSNIYRVRRSNGSGTSRAFDASFIGDFCITAALPMATATTLNSPVGPQCNSVANGGVKALQAGTSDDLASCLTSFNTANVAAVGYLSTDYQPGVSDGYRWIKVDGVSPKALNVVNNKWKFWSEESLNYNTAAGISGDSLSFYNAIKATSANNTLMSELVSTLTQTTSGLWTGAILSARSGGKNPAGWGIAPVSAVLSNTRTDATILTYPQNPMTHQNSSSYALCVPPTAASGYQPD